MNFSILFRIASVLLLMSAFVSIAVAADPSKALLRIESFDSDPMWEAHRNRIVPQETPTIVQDFGYSETNHAGRSAGEMGGQIRRDSEPAYYAAKIKPKTLADKLSAAGTFALTKTGPGGGIFFGYFNADQPGGGGRPIGSLGLNLGCEQNGGRLAVRLYTGENQGCGTFVTLYEPYRGSELKPLLRPAPLKYDGTRYAWTLDYDPRAADDQGRFTFTLQSDQHPADAVPADLPEATRQAMLSRFPHTTTFTVDLPAGYKHQGTTFDHFGVMNMMKAGGSMNIYFDDLKYDGELQDFSSDPHWDAMSNRRTYQATDVGAAHNFGFSATTSHAGGEPGEVGGVFWRTGANWGRYADNVEPLSFDDRLEASGKVKMIVGGPDADMCFGWFSTDGGDVPPNRGGEFLGIKVGGPTRVGHYFLPTFTVNEQLHGAPNAGPVLRPGTRYEWSLIYDPEANDGLGAITARLGDESVTQNLKPDQKAKAKAKAIALDHFGLFSTSPGGQIVNIYLDDLVYTASRP